MENGYQNCDNEVKTCAFKFKRKNNYQKKI